MAENKNHLTEKLLELDQQLEFELHSFSDNVSALTEAPERKQYDRFCGHLNYIQALLNDADNLIRELPLDRNDPDFYQILKTKGHLQEHAITYGRLRGGFFKKYRIEDERDQDLERVLAPEEPLPEIEELLPEEAQELTEEELFLLEQEETAEVAAQMAEAEAADAAKKKAKAKAEQRKREELQRRRHQEELAAEDAARVKQAQIERYRQIDEQEALLRAQQEEQISAERERMPADVAVKSEASFQSFAFQNVTIEEKDIHRQQEPAPDPSFVTHHAEKGPSQELSQPALHGYDVQDTTQQDRFHEASRLGFRLDPRKEICEAELYIERMRQEEEAQRLAQAAEERRIHDEAVQERFHQRQQAAEQHVRLEKGHVDFSHDLYAQPPQDTSENSTVSDTSDMFKNQAASDLPEEPRQKPSSTVVPPKNGSESPVPSAVDGTPLSGDSPYQQPENKENEQFHNASQPRPERQDPDVSSTRPAPPYQEQGNLHLEQDPIVVPPLSPSSPDEHKPLSAHYDADPVGPGHNQTLHSMTHATDVGTVMDLMQPTPAEGSYPPIPDSQPYQSAAGFQETDRKHSGSIPLSHPEEKPSALGTGGQAPDQNIVPDRGSPPQVPSDTVKDKTPESCQLIDSYDNTRKTQAPPSEPRFRGTEEKQSEPVPLSHPSEKASALGVSGHQKTGETTPQSIPASLAHTTASSEKGPSSELPPPEHTAHHFRLERQSQTESQRYKVSDGAQFLKNAEPFVPSKSKEQVFYQSTPFGVREDQRIEHRSQPSRNNAQIYSKIKRSMEQAGEGTPVSVSSAYLSSMAWNVHMARIDYQGKKDTAEAVQAARVYQKQRQALESLKADVRAGRVLVEQPKPVEPKAGASKTSETKSPYQTMYQSTPFGVTGTNISPDGQVTGSFRIHNKDVRERFRYTPEQPLKVSPKYEAAMQERLTKATANLDTALNLKTKVPPKLSFSMQEELRLAQDAYAAFQQAKQSGVVVVSDQAQLDKPDFQNWQQRKHANIFGTTVNPKAFDPTAPKKAQVERHSASILTKKSKLHSERFYSYYVRTLNQRTVSFANQVPNLLSRNMYMLMQAGEDNALRTFENGRYYALTAAHVASAVTHLHVVAPGRFQRHVKAQETQRFVKYLGLSNQKLSQEIHTNMQLARAGKQNIRVLKAQHTSLENQIERYTRLGTRISKDDALILKHLQNKKAKVSEKLVALQTEHSAVNHELRRQIAYQKFRKETAEEKRILQQLKKENGLFVTRGKLQRDIETTRKIGQRQLLEKYGEKLAGYSEKAVKQEIKLLTKQGQVLKSQIKALQAQGSSLTQAQRTALKKIMDKHQDLSKRLRKLIALDTDRGILNTEIKLKQGLLTRMHQNSNAFYSAMFAFKRFALRPMREGTDAGVQGFSTGISVMTNRHVHLMMKKTFKAVIRYAPSTVAFLATGDMHTARAAATYVERAANIAVTRTKIATKQAAQKTTKLAADGAKKAVSKITPQPVKQGVRYIASDIRGRFQVINMYKNHLKQKFWASRMGRGLSAFSEFSSNAAKLTKTAVHLVKSVGVKVIAGFVILFILCGVIASLAGAPAGGAASSIILTPYESTDGKLDLSPYMDILNECQTKYDEEIENNRAAYLEQYDKVTIVPAIPDDNSRELLSMMAVRCSQDLELSNAMVERYLKSIFTDSHFFTTEVSDYYSCSGCETKYVNKGHTESCPDPCYGIHLKEEKYCPGTHQDLAMILHVLFFDEIFTADSMGNQGQTAVAGQEIGTFKITHYCACKSCCGKDPSDPAYGITATGTKATINRTIAVDPNVIPLGTHVVINGKEYVAEDVGGAIDGNRIDIYVGSHQEALNKGVKHLPVYYASYEGGSVVETGEWDGWTEDNVFWCKNIYSMDWKELYTGIPNVTDVVGNETNLDGVTFIDGDRAGSEAIVNTALAQLGNVGGQPYWSWYGFDGRVEWCATFVSWCANQNGVLGTSIPKFASCRYEGVPWFQEQGQWASADDIVPVAGDIIFFDWEGDGVPNHVGIVIGTDGDKVYTIEGNSSDAVRTKSYNLDSKLIFGYGLPNY